MAKAPVYDMEGKIVEEIELDDRVFACKVKPAVLHQVVVMYLANQRVGTASTKTRAEVSGGGRKVWRQKGTGHARQGSMRAPHWRHGGVAHGPKPRDYSYTVPKRVRQLALRMALSAKLADGELLIVQGLELPEIKTKRMAEILQKLNINGDRTLLSLARDDELIIKSARNIPNVSLKPASAINAYDVLKHKTLLLDKAAVEVLQSRLIKEEADNEGSKNDNT